MLPGDADKWSEWSRALLSRSRLGPYPPSRRPQPSRHGVGGSGDKTAELGLKAKRERERYGEAGTERGYRAVMEHLQKASTGRGPEDCRGWGQDARIRISALPHLCCLFPGGRSSISQPLCSGEWVFVQIDCQGYRWGPGSVPVVQQGMRG